MFKWICLGVAVVFLAFIGWAAYDIRCDIRRSAETVQASSRTVTEHLPAIVEQSQQVSAVVTENLPTIVEKTRTTTDTLAELSEDVKQLKELAGLTGGTRDQNLVAYADSVLNLIDQSGGSIGLKKTLGGSGLKNVVPAMEWVVGARKEAVFLTLVVRSKKEFVTRLAKNKFGFSWYIQIGNREPITLMDWLKENHPATKELPS
jgi:hypothetical protein